MKKLFKFILNTIPRPILIRMSIVVRPILAFFLKGTKFTDPIDGKSFKMFLPYGYGNWRNSLGMGESMGKLSQISPWGAVCRRSRFNSRKYFRRIWKISFQGQTQLLLQRSWLPERNQNMGRQITATKSYFNRAF